MKPLRLKIRSKGEVIETLLVEDRGGGVDIRQSDAAFCDADRSAVVDPDVDSHCPSCAKSIAELIGLSDDEVEIISAWRYRKERGVSSSEMGMILDRMVKKLQDFDERCQGNRERLVIEVEYV